MKASYLFVCVALAIVSHADEQGKPIESPITWEELNRRHVIGELGKPLGTAVEIQAEVIAGRSLRLKIYDSTYLLKVTHVDGKEVGKPPVLRFNDPFSDAELANSTFALYELKHGTKATQLNSSQIAELEKGYVGRIVRLVVYEVGSFEGIPNELPDDVPVWQGFAFRFRTSLAVLKDREGSSQSGSKKR